MNVLIKRGKMSEEKRRERNMSAKRNRIFDAASSLFAEHGFSKVTTEAISQRADVAAGTLFRYAKSKADLLIMVYNRVLDHALAAGRQAAAQPNRDTVDAVTALVMPVLTASQTNSENAITYQKELLFGSDATPHRVEGLQLIEDLETDVAKALLHDVDLEAHPDAPMAARQAARIIFAILHLTVAEPSTHAQTSKPPEDELRDQIAFIVDGFLTNVNSPA